MGFFDSIIKGITGNPIVGAAIVIGIPLFLFRNQIGSSLSNFFNPVGAAVSDAGQTVVNVFSDAGAAAGDAAGAVANVGAEFGQTVENLDQNFAAGFTSLLEQAGAFFAGAPQPEPTPAADGTFEEGSFARPVGATDERTSVEFGTTVIVPQADELGIGGGESFIGGVTTFGDNLVDTLSEVLSVFPDLSASQAADLLAENQGLTRSQFAFLDPDVRNISNIEEENVIFNPASNDEFTGLTPEQIALILTGGNISNF